MNKTGGQLTCKPSERGDIRYTSEIAPYAPQSFFDEFHTRGRRLILLACWSRRNRPLAS